MAFTGSRLKARQLLQPIHADPTLLLPPAVLICSTTPTRLIASRRDRPCPIRTSTCRNDETISAGFARSFAILLRFRKITAENCSAGQESRVDTTPRLIAAGKLPLLRCRLTPTAADQNAAAQRSTRSTARFARSHRDVAALSAGNSAALHLRIGMPPLREADRGRLAPTTTRLPQKTIPAGSSGPLVPEKCLLSPVHHTKIVHFCFFRSI